MTTLDKIKERVNTLAAIKELWSALLTDAPIPYNEQFDTWFDLHSVENLMSAIKITARKWNNTQRSMTAEHLIRHCSSVANDLKYKKSPAQGATR